MTEPSLGNRAAKLIHDAMTAHYQACEEACRRCLTTFGYMPTETREHVDAGGILQRTDVMIGEDVYASIPFTFGQSLSRALASQSSTGEP